MKHVNLFDAILLLLMAFVLWMWVVTTPAKADDQYQKMDDISYCWASHYNFYLPCMYSEKVVEA
jgi:hypothetical protein